MKYRREIDGLRAVAVMPVILFHAGIKGFGGGFVGVDIFFVISGYLITSILISDLDRGDFSIARFYERRARRILPALFVVMLACLPFAYMWMYPAQLENFGKSIIAVIFFVSNILFWREDGYFAATAEEKPLLHTWSLSVEEQYYLIFPLLLFVLWRFGRNRTLWAIYAIAICSFLLAEWGWRNEPTANFYLAPTRAWELLAGSICAFLTADRPESRSDALGFAGLALILFSIFYYTEDTPFPSVYTLAPVLGVSLIILFSRTGTHVARILSWKPFVAIGLISYSAYLWHQPLFAFARIRSLTEPSTLLMAVLTVASFLLAWATWYWVEKPFRVSPRMLLPTRGAVFATSAVGGVAFLAVGLAGVRTNGMEFRFNLNTEFLAYFDNAPPRHPYLYRVNMFSAYKDECNYFVYDTNRYSETKDSLPESCYTKANPAHPTLFIWGDSHAQHLYYGINKVLDNEWNILQVASSGCAPAVPGSGAMRTICLRSNTTAFEAIKATRPDVVLLGYVGLWQEDELRSVVRSLKEAGVPKILVAGPSPRWRPSLPWVVASNWGEVGRRTWIGIDRSYIKYNEKLKEFAAHDGGDFRVLDIMSALCDADGCLTYIGDNIRDGLTSFDYGHLTPVASAFVATPVIVPELGR